MVAKSQKRIIYIILVMIFLASLITFLYLVFILINLQNNIIELDDKTTVAIGGALAILGIVFGNPLGKKWWHLIYEVNKRGAFLKVKD